MFWFILIVAILLLVVLKFSYDSKEVQERNQSLGGMRKLFPDFVDLFNKNGFEFVQNTGTKLLFRKSLDYNSSANKYLYLGLESKFTNFAFGYVITSDGEKISGKSVEFKGDYSQDDVEMIVRKITGDLKLRGILEQNI